MSPVLFKAEVKDVYFVTRSGLESLVSPECSRIEAAVYINPTAAPDEIREDQGRLLNVEGVEDSDKADYRALQALSSS